MTRVRDFFIGFAAVILVVVGGPVVAQSIPAWLEFTLQQRTGISSLAVPSFRPTTENSVIALDIYPNGIPVEWTNHGIAWIDVCGVDLELYPTAAGNCARVAVTSTDVRFGDMRINGGAPKPIKIISSANVIATFSIGSNGKPKIDVGGVDILAELVALKARIAALEAAN